MRRARIDGFLYRVLLIVGRLSDGLSHAGIIDLEDALRQIRAQTAANARRWINFCPHDVPPLLLERYEQRHLETLLSFHIVLAAFGELEILARLDEVFLAFITDNTLAFKCEHERIAGSGMF